ncbi:MAG TPA: MBL fold metallo-hydrolase [Candidatus Dormibacteraeota bacterium]
MREVAPGVWQLTTAVPNLINCYLAGDVLIDAGSRRMAGGMLRQLRGRTVREVALTHTHPDHQGGAHEICSTLGVPLACPAGEVGRMEGREVLPAASWYAKLVKATFAGPPHPVGRPLAEGDMAGGFAVYSTPGHSADHVVFFRESDGVAIVGDAVDGLNILTGLPGLNRPPDLVNEVPSLVNDAIRKVAELRPRVVCFGHGPVLTRPERFQAFAALLP